MHVVGFDRCDTPSSSWLRLHRTGTLMINLYGTTTTLRFYREQSIVITHVRTCIFAPMDIMHFSPQQAFYKCATLACRECAGSGPSISLLCTWFRQRVSIALQRSLAHAIHARTLRLEQSMAFLPPPQARAPLSSAELHVVASLSSIIGPHVCLF